MFCNSVAPAADFSLSTSMTFSSSSIPTVGLATIQKHTMGNVSPPQGPKHSLPTVFYLLKIWTSQHTHTKLE